MACDVSRLASLRILRTTVRGNRARAFLVSTRDAVIDACHVQYQTMSGINVYCDAKRASFQGSGVRNVTIRNSEFEGCAAAPIFVYAEASSPRPGAHKDITIEGNVFRASPPMDKLRLKPDKRKYLYWTSAIYLRSVDQAIVRNNTFDGFELAAYVGASKGVTLEGNRSALPAGVFLSEESRATVVFRNNVDLNAEIDATVPWSAHYYVVGQR